MHTSRNKWLIFLSITAILFCLNACKKFDLSDFDLSIPDGRLYYEPDLPWKVDLAVTGDSQTNLFTNAENTRNKTAFLQNGGFAMVWGTGRYDGARSINIRFFTTEREPLLAQPATVRHPGNCEIRQEMIFSDKRGGVFLVYSVYDWDVQAYKNVYVNRYDGSGAAKWGDQGHQVFEENYQDIVPIHCAIGTYHHLGLFYTLADNRPGYENEYHVMIATYDVDGISGYKAGNTGVCFTTGWKDAYTATEDEEGNVILIWENTDSKLNKHDPQILQAQRLENNSLLPEWSYQGIDVKRLERGDDASVVYDYIKTVVTSGESIFIAWGDNSGVFLDNITLDGKKAWNQPLHFPGHELGELVPDNEGGVFIITKQFAGATGSGGSTKRIIANHIDPAGVKLWHDGVIVADNMVLTENYVFGYYSFETLNVFWSSHEGSHTYNNSMARVTLNGMTLDGQNGFHLHQSGKPSAIAEVRYNEASEQLMVAYENAALPEGQKGAVNIGCSIILESFLDKKDETNSQ